METIDCAEGMVCLDSLLRCIDHPSGYCQGDQQCPSAAWTCDELGECRWLGFCGGDGDCPSWLPHCDGQRCRACVEGSALPKGALVEMEAVALC